MFSYHVVFPRFVVCLVSIISAIPLLATTNVTIQGADSLTVTLDTSGDYTVSVISPAWKFAGKTGVPVHNLYSTSGVDTMGPYREISFDFQAAGARHGAIRAYFNQKVVLFTLSNPSDAPNIVTFPSFSQYPKGLGHVNYAGMFGFPTFFGYAEDSPWVFFDPDANTFVVSPVTHAMVASTAWGPNAELNSGLSPKIATLPAGFSQQTMLVIENGINRAFDTWGHAMTDLHGKTRPANDGDVTLNRVGYWTDAGSTYYYSTEAGMDYSGTLSAIKRDFDKRGVSLGYLQLDSWFYPKGAGADWIDHNDGIYQYLAAPFLFPATLANFQHGMSTSLVTHSRWIDPTSPYRQLYRMSGNVSTDSRFWDEVANYLVISGVKTYEQDWLYNRAQTDFNLTDPEAFLDNMSKSLGAQNITIQYCMPSGRHFLQSAGYNNVTSIRVSEDRFDHTRWRSFLYASRLASALGVYPFADVMMSVETDNLLLSTLSAGPVGVGDRIGAFSPANLLRAVRADGVIVKPDVPLTPIDVSFLNDSRNLQAPIVASTYSDFGTLRTNYIFAYPQAANTLATFRLADAGVTQPAYLFDGRGGTGRVVDPQEMLNLPIADGYIYQVAAPIGLSGMAIIGDTGQFVTMGKKRVSSLTDDGIVQLTVTFAKGDGVHTIEGYSPYEPIASVVSGNAGTMVYDPATKRFKLPLMAGRDGTATVNILRMPASLAPVSEVPRGNGDTRKGLPPTAKH